MASKAELRIGAIQTSVLVGAVWRALGLRRVTVRVGDKVMPAFVRGRGTPIVFVHGFGADKESWLTFIGALDRKRAVVALDLPGFGASGAIDSAEASAGRQAEAVLGAMSQLGIDRAHLVGSSMGGGISQRIASDHPERVLSLTLLGSAASVGEPSELGVALARGENPLLAKSPEDFERLVQWMTIKRPFFPRAMMMHQGHVRMSRGPVEATLFAGFVNPPANERLPTALEALATPTLIIHGDKDPVIHPSTARILAERMPNATLEMLTDIGHLPHIESKRHVARLVDAFTRAHDPPILGA